MLVFLCSSLHSNPLNYFSFIFSFVALYASSNFRHLLIFGIYVLCSRVNAVQIPEGNYSKPWHKCKILFLQLVASEVENSLDLEVVEFAFVSIRYVVNRLQLVYYVECLRRLWDWLVSVTIYAEQDESAVVETVHFLALDRVGAGLVKLQHHNPFPLGARLDKEDLLIISPS